MKFALITEGVSEHNIIKNIIEKYFKESYPFCKQIQPQVINDSQKNSGGWNEVLKYCQRENDLKELFIDNDYLVIQIDTDKSQEPQFNISHTKFGGKAKSIDELYNEVVEKLRGLINPKIIEEYSNKIFFAISIHTIECWLLPIYFVNNDKTKTTGCISKLNMALAKSNISTIPTETKNKNSEKAIRTYKNILSNWKKREDISKSAQYNLGFKNFIWLSDYHTLI